MRLVPRDYQEHAVQSIFDYFSKGGKGNPLVALPVGTGKAFCIAYFLQKIFASWPSQKIMMLTHVKELIRQNYEELKELWPDAPCGVYSAGLGQRDVYDRIIFGGIASVDGKAKAFGHVDLIVVDECHLINPKESGMYRAFIGALKQRNPNLRVIGFTATPWRLGHGHITEDGLFTEVCCDMTSMEAFNWFVNQGYLIPLIPRPTQTTLNVDGVRKVGGDYQKGALEDAVDKAEITEAALREAMEMGHDRNRWLIFAAGVDHADHIAEMLTDLGIPCRSVHSKMTGKQRDDNLKWYKESTEEIRAIVNNGVLTTGFNHPRIDMIVMLRPTTSAILWVQMLGRLTRPFFMKGFDLSTQAGRLASIAASPKLNGLVLDFAGNTRRIGPINDPVIPKKKGEGGGKAPVKDCPICDTMNHASARNCIFCGAEFKFETKIKAIASQDVLIKTVSPIVEVMAVDHISFRPHEKKGAPLSMKVSYYCGYQTFTQWVCFEHEGYALKKARDWWRERTTLPFPETTEAALLIVDTLPPATHLRVWSNKQFPEIMATCFDGSAFGTVEVPDSYESNIQIDVKNEPSNKKLKESEDFLIPYLKKETKKLVATENYDDDIPF